MRVVSQPPAFSFKNQACLFGRAPLRSILVLPQALGVKNSAGSEPDTGLVGSRSEALRLQVKPAVSENFTNGRSVDPTFG